MTQTPEVVMDCDNARALFEVGRMGCIDKRALAALSAHVEECEACRRECPPGELDIQPLNQLIIILVEHEDGTQLVVRFLNDSLH